MASPTSSDIAGLSSDQINAVQNNPKLTTIDLVGGIYCSICQTTFGNKKEYDTHYVKHNNGSTDIVYTCVACHKEIKGYPNFRGHCYSNHVVKDKYKCTDCSKSFPKPSILKEHIKTVHMFTCNKETCKQQFKTQNELHIHQILHKKEGKKPPFTCQSCDQLLPSLDTCETHIDLHHTQKYNCPICDEDITKANAPNHLTKHFGEVLNNVDETEINDTKFPQDSSINIVGGIYCCYCETLYKNRMEFDTHVNEEHPNESIAYTCNICKKKFDKYSLFGTHCYDHISKDRYECEVCEKTFHRLSLLVMHTQAYHAGAGADKPYACPACAHAFKSHYRLRDHLRAAHRVEGPRCLEPRCPRTFETLRDLVLHQKNHKAALDNWCRQCGLQFTSAAACLKHLDVHRKKFFSCPVCSKDYTEKYLLMKHVPQHFESVLHMCNICGKIYNEKKRLVEHLKTHSSAKMYECNYCGKGFAKTNHLKQHINIHTGAMPYKCVACPKTFASHPNWNKHLRRAHKIDYKTLRNNENAVVNTVESAADSVNGFLEMQNTMPVNEFMDSDDSTMDSRSIDSSVIEKEAQIFEADMGLAAEDEGIAELTNVLPEHIAAFITEATAQQFEPEPAVPQPVRIPCEYGPDFTSGAEAFPGLDDHFLPHIDPNLTINKQTAMYVQYDNYDENIQTNSKWEPVITKIYGNYYTDDMMSVINTDIF